MKNYLHTLPYFLLFLIAAYIPPKVHAQCTCPDGDPVNTIVYSQTIDSISAITTYVYFPKFDPSIGTLFCLQLATTVTSIINIDLFNKDSMAQNYLLESYRRSQFTGPGGFISSILSPIKNYGPYFLGPVDPVGTADEVHIGPDTVFNNRYTSTNHNSNMTDFMGAGNFNFDYLNTSTTTLLQGSSRFDLFVRAYTRLTADLTYFWCPASVLATNIKNFSAHKKDNTILLKWVTENKTPGTSYEMEFSQDGINFKNIGQTDPGDIAGATSQHQFQYQPGTTGSGKLYFRIKQVDAQGKVTYSPIRTVNMNENATAGFIVYPNPVSKKVSMVFDRNLNGNYVVEITNVAGQILYNRNMKLNNSNTVQFELTNPPPSGMYYLKLVDTKSKLHYSNKLIIQR